MRRFGMMVTLLVVALLALPVTAQMQEQVDLDAIHKIREEGFQRSQVMETMSYLTDVYGPRLTNSPNIRQAAEWARKKLAEYGLVNAKLEPWGPFGRGWANERFSMNVIAPNPFPVIGYSVAWAPGTTGPITCDAAVAVMEKDEDLEKNKGKLKGKCVLTQPLREVAAHFTPQGERYTDAQLADLAKPNIPEKRWPQPNQADFRAQQQFRQKVSQFLLEEGAAAVIERGGNTGDGGTVFVGGVQRGQTGTPSPVRVVIAIEHYGRIFRTLEKSIPVSIELNVQNKFYDENKNSFNVIAEIPGTDKADEVVMLGAHFDSWHSGTGATDNGAGSAVMMEAVRILKASGVKLRRTVRIGLWTGEEQGLLGSREYVKAHFAEPKPDKPEEWIVKPEHSKLSGYFNIDNGTGKIRGVYLQGNDAIAPVFRAWMEPFANMGMTTLSIQNTGGTDHLSFDGVGLPGFQFIQDEIEYDTRTHHSNMDVYERIQEADMKQIAVIVASFVYQTANRPQMLPREPMPKPPQPRRPQM